MKIEDHSTAEIYYENKKRASKCSSCGIREWEEIDESRFRENKMETMTEYAPWTDNGRLNIVYVCKKCKGEIYKKWSI